MEWDRKQVGVSAGQSGQVFAIKHDKLLKSACLYSRIAFQNSPFEETLSTGLHHFLVKVKPRSL